MASKDNHSATEQLQTANRPDASTMERDRFERAAVRLREQLLHIPSYADKDRTFGMAFWRDLHASAPLYDG